MWTLTMPDWYTKPEQAYKDLPKLWDTMRKEIQREQGKFAYLAVVEGQPHRSEMPHFHVITFGRVPVRYSKRKDRAKNIKDFAAHCGFGHQAKDEEITSGRAAAYVAKYITKDGKGMPKGFRRVRCSRNWLKQPKPELDPYIVRSIGEAIADYLIRVENTCGRPIDDLLTDYQTASTKLTLERLMS